MTVDQIELDGRDRWIVAPKDVFESGRERGPIERPNALVLVLILVARGDRLIPLGPVAVERRVGIRRRIRLALIRTLLVRNDLRALAAADERNQGHRGDRNDREANHDLPPVGGGAVCPPGGAGG